jgi:hypothetical protein
MAKVSEFHGFLELDGGAHERRAARPRGHCACAARPGVHRGSVLAQPPAREAPCPHAFTWTTRHPRIGRSAAVTPPRVHGPGGAYASAGSAGPPEWSRRSSFGILECGCKDPPEWFRDLGVWLQGSAGVVSGPWSVVARIRRSGFGTLECGCEDPPEWFRDQPEWFRDLGVWSRGSAGVVSGSAGVVSGSAGVVSGSAGVVSGSAGVVSGPWSVVARISRSGFGTLECGCEDPPE